ncbi:HPP family protein [Chryseosolibacter indicus]|uniref:HPP family protein n=1 Tax=Chryseosolibacter indicus TaxID=2782351 RepID=A0ABS5VS81_9BACT|nr:HPP family protein [Chryseosolibacter indicus]MBT1704292.1 HPP family protein [Chryseosolibacter indicus]
MRKKIKRSLRVARIVVYKETLVNYTEHFWTFLGSFVGIGLIGLMQSFYLSASDNLFLVGSFGATSVLIYGVINSPLAQPRNVIGGHLISALVGVTINYFVPYDWLAAALAVSSSIVLMQITKTLHPPGGATALIAVIGSEKIKALGFGYVISPILSGVVILLFVAMVFNNITKKRSYPRNKYWYKVWKRKYL